MPIEIIEEGIAKACPLKRVGLPADIGRAVSLLVSEEGEWINGKLNVPVPLLPTNAFANEAAAGQVIKLSGGSAV